MHTGKTVGWAGRIERPAGAGSHPADPLLDTMPAGGLHKFDLGMVPASVTPPRTWRHAAWFAVASSAAALGGLLLATATLVSHSSSTQLTGLPSTPRGGVYPPLNTPEPHFLAGNRGTPEPPRPSRTAHLAGLVGAPKPGTIPVGTVVPARPVPSPAGNEPARPGPATPRPQATPLPQRLPLLTASEDVMHRSDQYFAAVASGDLHRAYAMTRGPLRAEGFESFAARYAAARTVEVINVTTRPNGTINTLRVTRPDGTVVTQTRELGFTWGDEPMVNADELVP